MIYAYLFDHVEPIDKRFDFDNQVDALGHRFDITEYRKHCPWFLDTALVFPGFASEAVKMLYQVSAHYIGAPTTVMEHMAMDSFGVGVTPGSVAIKTIILQIRIKPVNYGKICEQLDYLPSIKVGNEFMLHIHLDHTERFKLAQLFSVIKKAESALKYFKDEGHKADIMYNWDSLWSFSIDKFPNWTMDLLDKELLGFVPGVSVAHHSARSN